MRVSPLTVPQLGQNQSLKKADEWRRLLTITPILLWWCWKNDQDKIPNTLPPLPAGAVNVPDHSRNMLNIYSAVLFLCAAVCIIASRSISMAQAQLGQQFLNRYLTACLELGIHLVINHHMSVHYVAMIKLWGPIYSWWLFAFERFNGMLECVNTNGKDSGRAELTLMRNWIMTHLVYDLLLSLPENAHPLEQKFLTQIIKTEAHEQGSMMAQIAVYQAEANLGE